MTTSTRQLLRACCAFTLLTGLPLWAQDAAGDKTPEADPARPTVTNPAHLPPTGYLQTEQGFDLLADSPNDESSRIDRQSSFTQTTKIAVTDRLLIAVADQPYAHTTLAPGPQPSNETGDLLLTGQVVLFNSKHGHGTVPALSIAYTRRLRAGVAPSNDIGGQVQGVNVLFGGEVHHLHYDVNLLLNEEQAAGPQRRLQEGQTFAASYDLNKKISVVAEIWHFTQPLTQGNAAGTLDALTYTPRPNIVIDAGINHGLTSTSSQWTGFAGVTYLLPHRLWGSRS